MAILCAKIFVKWFYEIKTAERSEKEILTKIALTVSLGEATFDGCWITSPKLRPHFGVSYKTGGTRVIRLLCNNFEAGGPDGIDFFCNTKFDEIWRTSNINPIIQYK